MTWSRGSGVGVAGEGGRQSSETTVTSRRFPPSASREASPLHALGLDSPDNPANARHLPAGPALSRPLPDPRWWLCGWMCIPGAFFPLQPEQLSAWRLLLLLGRRILQNATVSSAHGGSLLSWSHVFSFLPPILFFFFLFYLNFPFVMHGETLIGQPLAW